MFWHKQPKVTQETKGEVPMAMPRKEGSTFKVLGTISFTKKEIRKIRQGKTTYKIIDGNGHGWYRLNMKANKQDQRLLKRIEKLESKLKELKEKKACSPNNTTNS